jgi:hypothetical protein
MDSGQLHKMIDQMNQQPAADGKPPFEWKTIPQGAATSVWAGFAATADEVGGRYCENCHVGAIVPDDVVISAISEGVRAYALDPHNAEALWKRARNWSQSLLRNDKQNNSRWWIYLRGHFADCKPNRLWGDATRRTGWRQDGLGPVTR